MEDRAVVVLLNQSLQSVHCYSERGRRTQPEAGLGLWAGEQERGQTSVPGNQLGSTGCRQEATYFFFSQLPFSPTL